MRIAIISEHASPLAALGGTDSGGQNVYVSHIARQLARAGHIVDVFTRRDDPQQAVRTPLARNANVISIDAGPCKPIPKEQLLPHMDEFARNILAYCRRSGRRYDVAHANFFMSGLAALALRNAFGTPFVMTFHALGKVRKLHQREADAFPPERIAIEGMLADVADRVIAECPQDRDDLIAHYDADPDRIETVPCGFDPAEFGPGDRRMRAELGLDEKDFVVLQLGRLVPRKGIDNVIRGVALLKHQHGIKAKLVVVGGETAAPDPRLTPEIGRLVEVALQSGVLDQVTFTGARPRQSLRHFYSAADVFVTTPWYEPFGITPLEAMACGCPVVGAAVGGIQYSVEDGLSGYLVAPNDPHQLAERLARLHANPGLRQAMGKAGMLRVASAFTWKQVGEKLERIYADLLPIAMPMPMPTPHMHSNANAIQTNVAVMS